MHIAPSVFSFLRGRMDQRLESTDGEILYSDKSPSFQAKMIQI